MEKMQDDNEKVPKLQVESNKAGEGGSEIGEGENKVSYAIYTLFFVLDIYF
jgi:hypothetical protein